MDAIAAHFASVVNAIVVASDDDSDDHEVEEDADDPEECALNNRAAYREDGESARSYLSRLQTLHLVSRDTIYQYFISRIRASAEGDAAIVKVFIDSRDDDELRVFLLNDFVVEALAEDGWNGAERPLVVTFLLGAAEQLGAEADVLAQFARHVLTCLVGNEADGYLIEAFLQHDVLRRQDSAWWRRFWAHPETLKNVCAALSLAGELGGLHVMAGLLVGLASSGGESVIFGTDDSEDLEDTVTINGQGLRQGLRQGLAAAVTTSPELSALILQSHAFKGLPRDARGGFLTSRLVHSSFIDMLVRTWGKDVIAEELEVLALHYGVLEDDDAVEETSLRLVASVFDAAAAAGVLSTFICARDERLAAGLRLSVKTISAVNATVRDEIVRVAARRWAVRRLERAWLLRNVHGAKRLRIC